MQGHEYEVNRQKGEVCTGVVERPIHEVHELEVRKVKGRYDVQLSRQARAMGRRYVIAREGF